MKMSARNQIKGTISEVKKGKVNTEVVIKVDENVTLVSIITNDAAEDMALVVGDVVYAVVKASFVIVSKDKPSNISSRNVLETKVSEVKNGAVNGEIKLAMGNQTITSIITEGSVEELGLNVGDTAYALIKANFIILAK